MGLLFLYSYAIVLLSCLTSISHADTCVAKEPCICVFPNGTGIDLTPAVSTTFYSADTYQMKANSTQFEMSTYYFHPCFDVNFNATEPLPTNTCNVPLSVCRHVSTLTATDPTKKVFNFDAGVYDFMGKTNISQFSANGESLIYPNGPSSTIVLLQCSQTENRLQVFSLTEPDQIVLAFYSKDACLKQIEDVGRSFGSTLCIIFFSFVIFYLVLGICTKKFLMGATGIEVIPNLAFWSELPNLVKDGWRFMINGFKLPARGAGPTVSPDPNSYDSI